MTPSDPRISRAYFSTDSRNYAFQVPASTLESMNIGLPGSFHDPSHRYWVVVSFGDFDPSKVANIRSGAPLVPGESQPVRHASVAYVILDAITGQYQGEEFKDAGCARG